MDKIQTLNEHIWEHRANRPAITAWLDNFAGDTPNNPSERLHALHILSQFMYFGDREIRALLRALYRDLIEHHVAQHVRNASAPGTDLFLMQLALTTEMSRIRYLGMGNAGDSGAHILYLFKKSNALPDELFLNHSALFASSTSNSVAGLADPAVNRLVFLDDFCGSGQQGELFAHQGLADIRAAASASGVSCEIWYLALAGTDQALEHLRGATAFDRVEAVLTFDYTYKCFEPDSRYYPTHIPGVDAAFARATMEAYGDEIYPGHPLGFRDGQLLLSFHHNTPDNTLPVVWGSQRHLVPWQPIFPRQP